MQIEILILDIETAPHKAYVWGLYDQNVGINQIVEPGYTLCYAAKWYGRPGVMFGSVYRHKPARMARTVHALLDKADAVVHFNGKKFDVPTLNKEFLLNGMPPPAPFKHIDLLQTCRQQFKFASNKLDYVSQVLGEGAKVEHKGMELWRGCMDGDAASWRLMEQYNRHDVRLTERLYERLKPWIKNHPNIGVYTGCDEKTCPTCGSDRLQRRGYKVANMLTYAQYQCQKCKSWSRGRHAAQRPSPGALVAA